MMRFFPMFSEVLAVLSERRDGRLAKLSTAARSDAACERYARYLGRIDVPPHAVIGAGIAHGARVVRVGALRRRKEHLLRIIPGVDGLVTDVRGIFLAITVADCFPLFLYDPLRHVVGIAHAGWRGVVRGIVPKTIAELLRLGSQPHNLYAVIGPGIRACHFTVRSDTLPAFRQWPYALLKRGKRDRLRAHVDLPRIIRTQLRSAGVLPKHIEEVNICSYSARNRCFSYRRRRAEGGASGRMLALIGLRNRTEN